MDIINVLIENEVFLVLGGVLFKPKNTLASNVNYSKKHPAIKCVNKYCSFEQLSH